MVGQALHRATAIEDVLPARLADHLPPARYAPPTHHTRETDVVIHCYLNFRWLEITRKCQRCCGGTSCWQQGTEGLYGIASRLKSQQMRPPYRSHEATART